MILVGWWCWRCENVNLTACKSDSVPMYVENGELGEELEKWIQRERD